jgi:hypothetical protein
MSSDIWSKSLTGAYSQSSFPSVASKHRAYLSRLLVFVLVDFCGMPMMNHLRQVAFRSLYYCVLVYGFGRCQDKVEMFDWPDAKRKSMSRERPHASFLFQPNHMCMHIRLSLLRDGTETSGTRRHPSCPQIRRLCLARSGGGGGYARFSCLVSTNQ